MPDILFSDQTILLANSLLISVLQWGLWLSDRGQRHNLYWAAGLFFMFVVIATFPTVSPTTLTPVIWVCVFAGAGAIPMLLQGTAIYAGRPLPVSWLLFIAVLVIGLFALLRAVNIRGAIVPVLGIAAVFWYMAWVLRAYGIAERIAASLFLLRGVMVVVAAATSGFTLGGGLNIKLIAANQIVAMASSLALLLVAFLANQRELERGRQLLRQGNLIAQRLGQLHDTQSVVRESIEILLRAEPGSTAWIYRLDEEQQRLFMLDSGGRLNHLSSENPELAVEGSVSGRAVRTGRVQVIDHLASDVGVNARAQALAKTHPQELAGTNVIIPLLSGDRVYGTCSFLLAAQRKLNEADFEAYAALGQTIGLALTSVGNLEEMTFRANHDQLTKLPNRGALHEAFRRHAAENSDQGATMFLLDLDKFKEVNDTLGHHVGDQLLTEIGPRLSRVAAPEKLFAARLGGDEFVLLLMETLDRDAALGLGTDILEAVRAPFAIDELSLSIDGSIGVSICPRDGSNSHELLRCADVAMYQAKSSTTPVVAYSQSFDPHSRERLALMSDLKASLDDHQLFLEYQPKIHLPTDRFSGVEALLRWQHPERGLIPPGKFMPMAEVSPMINPISLWVMARAIEQIQAFEAHALSVAINVSMRNLADDTWFRKAIELIEAESFDASRLELELTESVFLHAPEEASRKLNALADVGVRIAIDDFGTGYSSLNYLRKLPINQLKIDRSFVINLDEDFGDRQIVESILSLAYAMDLEVVAEGVENEDTLQHLRELNCDYAQGFHICRPLPSDRLEAWILDHEAKRGVVEDGSPIEVVGEG